MGYDHVLSTLVNTFHSDVGLIFDTDKDISVFEYLPRRIINPLHDLEDFRLYLEDGAAISSNLAKSVKDPEMRKVFSVLRKARDYVSNNHQGVLCSDILLYYPRDMTEKLRQINRSGEIVPDVAFRNPGDTICGRDGQAFFDIGFGPNWNSDEYSEFATKRDARKFKDQKVRNALDSYMQILLTNNILVKPKVGMTSDILDLVRSYL